mmetsp:Transcript_16245/g.27315  ORF Transcript_16245/g.27315 Transcript_16245/m.27315 type:complete len:350 (+) Transcript_16245:753-1802(+)
MLHHVRDQLVGVGGRLRGVGADGHPAGHAIGHILVDLHARAAHLLQLPDDVAPPADDAAHHALRAVQRLRVRPRRGRHLERAGQQPAHERGARPRGLLRARDLHLPVHALGEVLVHLHLAAAAGLQLADGLAPAADDAAHQPGRAGHGLRHEAHAGRRLRRVRGALLHHLAHGSRGRAHLAGRARDDHLAGHALGHVLVDLDRAPRRGLQPPDGLTAPADQPADEGFGAVNGFGTLFFRRRLLNVGNCGCHRRLCIDGRSRSSRGAHSNSSSNSCSCSSSGRRWVSCGSSCGGGGGSGGGRVDRGSSGGGRGRDRCDWGSDGGCWGGDGGGRGLCLGSRWRLLSSCSSF